MVPSISQSIDGADGLGTWVWAAGVSHITH